MGDDIEEGMINITFRLGRHSMVDVMEAHDRNSRLESLGGVEGVANAIRTSPTQGLSKQEIDTGFVERQKEFGVNRFPEPPHKNVFQLFVEALKDTTILILLGAAAASIILQTAVQKQYSDGWYEGTAIFLAVIIVATVTSFNNYTQEKQFRKLNEVELDKRVKVIRAGEKREIMSTSIQVGEILLLEKGDVIPADGLCVSSFNLLVDESSMTGESDMIEKDPHRIPFMLSGCMVCDGMGTMMVTCVGSDSQWGKALGKLSQEQEDTPLQEKLTVLAGQIGKVGLAASLLTFAALTITWAIDKYVQDKQEFEWGQLTEVLDFFIIGVTIFVVAVPEGLPLAVTISLAYSMKKMMKDNNLVRKLQACETMGGATTICSDKTGTLTTNQMTVLQGWVGGIRFRELSQIRASIPTLKLLSDSISINSTAYIEQRGVQRVQIGNKTECAMLNFIDALGVQYDAIRRAADLHKIYSFTSDRKRMSTVARLPGEGVFRMYTKGASEILLSICTGYATYEGETAPLTDEVRELLNGVIEEMAVEGLRTIAICYKDLENGDENSEEPPETNLILIGLVGIKDPIRPEVPFAIRKCQTAGIKVRMVTGDNLATARTIARECGLLTDGGIIMEGPEFRKLTPDQMQGVIPRLQVLARSSPIDKYTLVHNLKEMGEVVAVTGDGTNDAPALKEAHVGLAMGIAGTEVAKEASDIIIMDDNFSSIVSAVMWGRCVFDNIRKFLQFQLTINLVALTVAFIAAVTNRGLPLKTVQLLWVNLIMDTLAALALGTETPTSDLLDRKPYGANERLINWIMIRNMVVHMFFQLAVFFTLVFAGDILLDLPYDPNISPEPENKLILDTIVFNTFVITQIFNEINSRLVTNKWNPFVGMFTNWVFCGILVFTAILQVMIVQFGGRFLETEPLNPTQWGICVGLGALSLVVGFISRLIPIDWVVDWFKRRKERKTVSTYPVFTKDSDGSESAPLLQKP